MSTTSLPTVTTTAFSGTLGQVEMKKCEEDLRQSAGKYEPGEFYHWIIDGMTTIDCVK